jgi:two-component sensor histidine kinase
MIESVQSREPVEDAHFELSFSPNARLVSPVRRFVSEFYSHALGDADVTSRLAIATHELLENAVRYSLDGNTSIRIGLSRQPEGVRVTIDTRNRAPGGHIESLRGILDELCSAADPARHFQVMMRRISKRTEGSGLGLGRVRAESGMAMEYRIDGDTVMLRAHAKFDVAEVA